MYLFEIIFCFIIALIKPIFAYDGGDIFAFIIGFIVFILLFLTCIGVCVRKRDPEMVNLNKLLL